LFLNKEKQTLWFEDLIISYGVMSYNNKSKGFFFTKPWGSSGESLNENLV
jgi:hypothetical protein